MMNEKASNRSVNAIPLNGICVVCNHTGKFRCGNCKTHIFCSKTCQLIDWKTHHLECNAILDELLQATREFSLYDQCLQCEKGVLRRVYGWDFMCQECYNKKAVSYYTPEHDKSFLKLSALPSRSVKMCVKCNNQSLMVLRDEMLDEWLACIACEKMKQLLRCWNPFLKQYVTIVEHPIVKIEQDAVEDDSEEYLADYMELTSEAESVADLDVASTHNVVVDSSTVTAVDEFPQSEAVTNPVQYFKKRVTHEKPYEFKWYKEGMAKDPLDSINLLDLKSEPEVELVAALVGCGVDERKAKNLNKTELIHAYCMIAANKSPVLLVEELAMTPPAISPYTSAQHELDSS